MLLFTRRMGLCALVSIALAGCGGAPDWNGRYDYEASYGDTAGGTPMVLAYQLQVDRARCQVQIDGFQTAEALPCRAESQGDALVVRYAGDANWAQSYPRDAWLFTLQRRDGQLITTWGLLRTLDLQTPPEAVRFAAVPR